jgi:preprotein translocase subunit SecF
MFRGVILISHDVKIPFVRFARVSFWFSIGSIFGAIALVLTLGLNFGIDFSGGTLIELQTQGPTDLGELRTKVGALGMGDVQLQEFGAADTVLLRVETQPGGEEAQQRAVDKIKAALGDQVTYRRVEVVGPRVSQELITNGIYAVVLTIVGILLYIWFRFEWQFALGAVLSIVHDVALTIGLWSILQFEFDLSILAAILTIMGYSLNDTVVIYDRMRENLRKYKKMPLTELIDLSINSTLARTINTSITTFVAVLALYYFGGEVIRGFNFAMLWGIVIGTYSSICVAAPVLIYFHVKREWGAAPAKAKAGSKVSA